VRSHWETTAGTAERMISVVEGGGDGLEGIVVADVADLAVRVAADVVIGRRARMLPP
jgi:hypothetical protein